MFLDRNYYFRGEIPTIIPHRGGINVVPENTLHAIEHTVENNFTHFETDLRMTKDGEIILHHDATLERTTHHKGKISQLDWKDLKKINAGSRFYERKNVNKETTFVLLREALKTFDELCFNLDLKESGMAKKVYRIIKETKAENRTLVSSFSPLRLDEFIKISKGEIFTSGSFRENVIARYFPTKKRNFKVQALQAPFIYKGLKVHSRKLKNFSEINKLYLHIWTVNTEEDFNKCLEFGCDGIMTDEPLKLKKYLEQKT